jgi:hypothetical protein
VEQPTDLADPQRLALERIEVEHQVLDDMADHGAGLVAVVLFLLPERQQQRAHRDVGDVDLVGLPEPGRDLSLGGAVQGAVEDLAPERLGDLGGGRHGERAW